MPKTPPVRRPKKPAPFNYWKRLKEVGMFFAGKDEVHKTLRRIINRLKKSGIPYAVMGGMAVNAHKYVRTTGDVDLLLTPEGFEEFRRRYVGRYYATVEGRSRRLVDRANDIGIDFLLTGRYPGSGAPGPVRFPDPERVGETIDKATVVNLPTLVELKLAARRHRDFGDVVELIRFNDLDESFADRLHPSVRRDYIECLEEKRREDDYEAREG